LAFFFDISSWNEKTWFQTGGTRSKVIVENPAFSFFKRKGIIIFKVSEVAKYKNLMSFEELALNNRPILKTIYSHSQVVKEPKELIQVTMDA